MTREECIALLDRYANYDGMGIPNLAGCKEAMKKAVELLSAKPAESLEEAARRYAIPTYMKDVDENFLDEYPYDPVAEKAFIAGTEWQKHQDQETVELAEEHAMLAGQMQMKEEMMKEAVEGEVEERYNDGESQCTVGVGTYFKPGEKVYILKAEEEQR